MPSADLAARTQQENAAAGPSRPASRSSLKSNLSAQLSGLFSRNSMDTTNERSALLPPSRASGSAGHSRESTDPGAGSSVGGGGIRRNYTQEMDGNEEEEDGKIPAAARTPQSTLKLLVLSSLSKLPAHISRTTQEADEHQRNGQEDPPAVQILHPHNRMVTAILPPGVLWGLDGGRFAGVPASASGHELCQWASETHACGRDLVHCAPILDLWDIWDVPVSLSLSIRSGKDSKAEIEQAAIGRSRSSSIALDRPDDPGGRK